MSSISKVELNLKVYDLRWIYATIEFYLDKSYIQVYNYVPKKKICLTIMPKTKDNSDIIALEFLDEVIKFAFFDICKKSSSEVSNLILKRVTMI
jgi:hypothetical protein